MLAPQRRIELLTRRRVAAREIDAGASIIIGDASARDVVRKRTAPGRHRCADPEGSFDRLTRGGAYAELQRSGSGGAIRR